MVIDLNLLFVVVILWRCRGAARFGEKLARAGPRPLPVGEAASGFHMFWLQKCLSSQHSIAYLLLGAATHWMWFFGGKKCDRFKHLEPQTIKRRPS